MADKLGFSIVDFDFWKMTNKLFSESVSELQNLVTKWVQLFVGEKL